MDEIINLLMEIANENGWKFVLGYEATLKLFDEALNDDDVVLMVDANITENENFEELGSGQGRSDVVNVFVARKGAFDETLGNEAGFEIDTQKWGKLMELYEKSGVLIKQIQRGCRKFHLFNVQKVLVINAYDVNLDGFLLRLDFKERI